MTELKNELKMFVFESECPDLKAFSIMRNIPYSNIDKPELALLRELAYLKQILYLRKKQTRLIGKDNRLNEPMTPTNNSLHVYDAFGVDTITRIEEAEQQHKNKVYKNMYFWFVASLWLTIGAIILAKLLSVWL